MSFKKLAALCALVALLLAAVPFHAFAVDDGSMYAVVDGSPVDMSGDTLLFTVPVRTASGTRTDLYAESLSRGTRQCLGPVAPGEAAVFVDDVVFARPTASGTRIILRNLTSGAIKDLGYGSDPQIHAFSPVGRLAVFTSKRSGSDATDIWSYGVTSKVATIVAGGPGDQTQPWLDGGMLAFRQAGQGVRVKDLVSGAVTTVTTSPDAIQPIVSGTGWAAWTDIRIDETMDGQVRNPAGLYRKLPDGEVTDLEGMGAIADLTGSSDVLVWAWQPWLRVRRPGALEQDTQNFGWITAEGSVRSPAICGNAIAWRQIPPRSGMPVTIHTASLIYNVDLTASTTSPRSGSAVTLGGRVKTKDSKAVVGLPVAIEKWNGSRWSGVGVGTTSAYGRFVCTVRPTVKTTYRLRYLARGSEPPAFSEKVTVYPR